MNEQQFREWLDQSLDRQPIPRALVPNVTAGVRPRSVMTSFITAVVPTLAIIGIAVVAFGVRGLHFTTTTQASPRPAPIVSPTASPQANASCQLPLSVIARQGQPPLQAAGFLTYPAGRFVADPSVHPAATIWAFDRVVHRWVPSLSSYLSPDGRHYIDNSTNDSLVIVDAVSGVKTSLVNSGLTAIFGWSDEGIVYRGQTGIQLLDPQIGASHKLSVPVMLPYGRVQGSALWVIGVNANAVAMLVRQDLTNGQSTFLYTFNRPAHSTGGLPQILGFDQLGNPVILDAPSGFSSAYQVLIVTGGQKATTIYSGQPGSRFRPTQQAIADTHGIWMRGSDGSLWLFDSAQGLQVVPLPAGSPTIAALGGPCS